MASTHSVLAGGRNSTVTVVKVSLDLIVGDGIRVTGKISINPPFGLLCPSGLDLLFPFRS